MRSTPIQGRIRQIGYLTDDLTRDMHTWMTGLGVGPFVVYRGLTLPGTFHGESIQVKMDVGFAFQGELQIELIQQTCDSPSPYTRSYEAGVLGPHHVAWVSDDFEADVARAQAGGFTLVASLGAKAMGRYAYFTASGAPGVYYELLENSRALAAQWAAHLERCASWDGDPSSTIEYDLSGFGAAPR